MNPQNDEQIRLLREILKWTKFAGMKELKDTIVSVLNTEQKRVVYHLSDGAHKIEEINRLVGISSTRTVFDLWQVWLRLGLGESIPVRGGSRFKRSFDLEELGIEIPRIKEAEKEEKQVEVQATTEKTEVTKPLEDYSHA
jgi:hypothetical protein